MSRKRGPNRRNYSHLLRHLIPKSKCWNCGQPGRHFVPPSFGDKGFYLCKKERADGER